tara:strand:+ start:363 stop:827 length:465 start_codon:yes stop_codon:yes gene_type:complete
MICQLNIVQTKFSRESSEMTSFFSLMPEINSIAEKSAGFLWRQHTEDESLIAARLGHNFIANLSSWQSIDSLYEFVFCPPHQHIMMARDRWFSHTGKAPTVIWDIKPDQPRPSWSDAIDRLEHLWSEGASEWAYDFNFAKNRGDVDPQIKFNMD